MPTAKPADKLSLPKGTTSTAGKLGTILGVIISLRFGWTVGQVGLLKNLLIVLLAEFLTTDLLAACCIRSV